MFGVFVRARHAHIDRRRQRRGQSQTEPLAARTLEHIIPFDVLADLPSSDNLPSLLGAVLPELIPDRLDTGGISTGEAARLGAHGSTWTQTQYRLGDVDITDPDGSGTPLFVPGVLEWQRVSVVDRVEGHRRQRRRSGCVPGPARTVGDMDCAGSKERSVLRRSAPAT